MKKGDRVAAYGNQVWYEGTYVREEDGIHIVAITGWAGALEWPHEVVLPYEQAIAMGYEVSPPYNGEVVSTAEQAILKDMHYDVVGLAKPEPEEPTKH